MKQLNNRPRGYKTNNMPYCKHCKNYISSIATTHYCGKAGLLNVDEDDSFIVSTIIGAATDSALLGGLLGGDTIGGILGDLFDGDLFD
jgi:hypothetical protein